MDKVIFRMVLALACLTLISILIVMPVFTSMYIRMEAKEKKIEQAEIRIDKKIKQLEQLKGE